MKTRIEVTAARRRTQSGQEIIEFGLTAVLLVPLLLGSVITGMGLIRSMQAQQICRDLASIYIHGGDFSTYPMQQLAQRLSRGLNLQIGASFTGSTAQNTANAGDAVITVSQIYYVGPTSGATCTSVGGTNCTNHDSFVYTQRIRFGNGSLASLPPSGLKDPTTTAISTAGAITSPFTDAGARVPGTSQTDLQTLWMSSSTGRAPLVDGQVIYAVEYYLQGPASSMGVGATYARYYF